jgi:hypothetical protein
MKPPKQVRDWYSKIGKIGGKKSKRKITKEQQQKMQMGRGYWQEFEMKRIMAKAKRMRDL